MREALSKVHDMIAGIELHQYPRQLGRKAVDEMARAAIAKTNQDCLRSRLPHGQSGKVIILGDHGRASVLCIFPDRDVVSRAKADIEDMRRVMALHAQK